MFYKSLPAAVGLSLLAAAAQAQDPARTGAGRNAHAHRAVDGGRRDLAAQNSLVDGNGQRDDDIVALPAKHRMGSNKDCDQSITGRTTSIAKGTLAA
jgi:hypothetical protein